MSWSAEDMMQVFKITKEEAETQIRERSIDRLKYSISTALRTARQEGLSGEDMEEAWRLVVVAEVQSGLLSPEVPFISL